MGLDRQDVTYTGGQSQHGVSILCPESPGMTPSRGSPEQMAQAVSHRAVRRSQLSPLAQWLHGQTSLEAGRRGKCCPWVEGGEGLMVGSLKTGRWVKQPQGSNSQGCLPPAAPGGTAGLATRIWVPLPGERCVRLLPPRAELFPETYFHPL